MGETAGAADILATFGRGFFRADEALLRASTTDDFEWHLHAGPEAPDGRVVRGVEETLGIIRERRLAWSRVRYSGVETTVAGNLLVQTFLVEGVDERGVPFRARGVDLYRLEGGLVARKDSFWKQILPS